MSEDNFIVDKSLLEPLFKPWEMPTSHRIKTDEQGKTIEKGRRPSNINIANNLRPHLEEWRNAGYIGASDTTKHLLDYWFKRSHRIITEKNEEIEFRYYFCQREAIEAIIYLKEVMRVDTLSQLIHNFEGAGAEFAVLGIEPDENYWSRYALKLATGAGKTKCMSLAIVWSYFHSLRESDSQMPKHFLIIAPNLTVFERLKDDFKPDEGGGDIFDKDPLIPPEWRGDWNLSTVIQDEAGGVSTGGTLYLSNIHRLYASKSRRNKDADTYDFMGPKVLKEKVLDTGKILRERIVSHNKVMVLNDEAHHLWDPDNAWSEAIKTLHDEMFSKNGGVSVQLDFTATPKDNKGRIFKHVICDTPLGEAVDSGIVKCPIIGSVGNLDVMPNSNAAYKYEMHLKLGYERWVKSKNEWDKSNKKALLFVMCNDTKEADEITRRLNTDPIFKELNERTVNLHTNLKGRIKNIGTGKKKRKVFIENEKKITDADLKELRKLSRNLDSSSSPYYCIVSVLMLREGWDVKNVTTIVPLRPYSSKAMILPEQTLGRGLRRMTPPGTAVECVTVVEHEAFVKLNQETLAQEGLDSLVLDVKKIPSTTISIFPDEAKKNFNELDILIPVLSAGHQIKSNLENFTLKDVKKSFRFPKLSIGKERTEKLDYEGINLITDELVEVMKIDMPILQNPIGAVSFFVKELELACKIKGIHSSLAPIIQRFIEEVLFDEEINLFDSRLLPRLGHPDVREYIRAVFIPLIREKITTSELRRETADFMQLSQWRSFQVTISERHPVVTGCSKTLFNLVPCDSSLEESFTHFLETSEKVAKFAKNAGPQALRIDYLSRGSRLAFYKTDFICELTDGRCLLIETKGRVDSDVKKKAMAAIEWCKSASQGEIKWQFVYIPEGEFQRFNSNDIEKLISSCEPALHNLLNTDEDKMPLFDFMFKKNENISADVKVLDYELVKMLPGRYKAAAEEAEAYFIFAKEKDDFNFAPAFTALCGVMDDACKGLILRKLKPCQPSNYHESVKWFSTENIPKEKETWLRNLKNTIVHQAGISPIGLLRNCLNYALNERDSELGGVFKDLREQFRVEGARKMLEKVQSINTFRNTYVAHQESRLTEKDLAKTELLNWIEGLYLISKFI
ncbi:MAG: DEAD/DEAH box helicase family protein [Verrucomicrobiota bacterium]|nr:DEAD/DEAH box helicase family protein [Verrucomicrobiota bacterium]